MILRACACLLLGVTVPALAQYPTRPPEAAPLRPVRFPPFVRAQLSNGASLLVVESHKQPVVTISLSVGAGQFHEPAEKTGLAGLLADLMTKGTERRTADQIAAEIETAGGSIGAGAGDDFLTITVSSLSPNLGQALDLLADVVAHSTFPESEVELSRTRALSGLQANLAEPDFLADRAFDREVYGSHPYGRGETPASLRGITREDVLRFYRERVRPRGALLVIAGDVDPAAVQRTAERAFAAWTGSPAPAPAAAAPPARTRTEIVLVHKPGAVQSNLVAGFTFITPSDPDFYALTLANQVLGGGPDSRLFLILREQKGWTYGAYSSFSRPRGVGAFRATAEVRTEVTDSALGELLLQLNRMRAEAPPDSEITSAKNYLVGRFPLTIETPQQIARAVANARLLGLPDDYVLRYRERLAAVTQTQIAAASRRRLLTDRMVVVVVGDGPRILAGLKRHGPVRIVDAEGNPLTEESLAPRTGGVALNTGALRPGTWRYRVLVQGNPFGEESRTLERASEGGRELWRLIENTQLGPIGRQDDTVLVEAASLRPVRVRQSGRIQGQETFVRIDYEGGRVRGQVRSPRGPGQMREAAIDTTLAEGMLDDNSVGLVVMSLPHAAGARWSLPLYSAGDGAVKSYTVVVEGEESVTTPAGTFACWRIAVQGGQVPVTMFVARDRAMIVKVELTGVPLVFELVGSN